MFYKISSPISKQEQMDFVESIGLKSEQCWHRHSQADGGKGKDENKKLQSEHRKHKIEHLRSPGGIQRRNNWGTVWKGGKSAYQGAVYGKRNNFVIRNKRECRAFPFLSSELDYITNL